MLIFKPKNSNFKTYDSKNEEHAEIISPRIFSMIIKKRSEMVSLNRVPAGGQIATDYFIDQIDMSDPGAFTLAVLPFAEWHVVMDDVATCMTV